MARHSDIDGIQTYPYEDELDDDNEVEPIVIEATPSRALYELELGGVP